MHLHFSRRSIHALICALILGVIAGVIWLEGKGYGRSLTSWEYRFRDAITAAGRFEPPDARLVFLGIDSSSVNFSQVDLQSIAANLRAGSSEERALHLIAAGWPWSREVYALLAERSARRGRARR